MPVVAAAIENQYLSWLQIVVQERQTMKRFSKRPTKRLVLVGAGHAHLRLIRSIPKLISQGVEVTVLDRRAELFYSGMMPAVLGRQVALEAARIPIREIVSRNGATFVQEPATGIDASRRVVGTETTEFSWDVASVAIGSRVKPPVPVDPGAFVMGAKPVGQLPELLSTTLRRLEALRDRSLNVVFIGGGASAVELAGNLLCGVARTRPELMEKLSIVIVSRGTTLLPRMPVAAQQIARESLSRRGIRIELEKIPRAVGPHEIQLEDGEPVPADITVFCTGLSAPTVLAGSRLPTDENGALLVTDTLRMADVPIFGGGDCISIEGMELDRIGVHAVRQSGLLCHNIARELEGRSQTSLRHYRPPESPLLILNLGDGTGILIKRDRVFHGSLPYRLKERIDWEFVRSGGIRTRPAWRAPPRPPYPA
jgi:NADH dehydrogenase FAD-containing subunit